MSETAVEKARRKFEEARKQLLAAQARESVRERKIATRRRVILGGAILELASRDQDVAALLKRIVAGLSREQDRKVFEGWDASNERQSEK